MIKNAIVVMFDSLQFNYLGCYGNTWIRTPNMDRLAREGVLFENCYIEGLPTVPCRRAMHTGRYTLPASGWCALSMDDTMISDLCWGRPIDTALIFDCPMYRLPKFGYTRGFDKVWFTHGHEADDYFYECDPLIHEKLSDYMNEASHAAYVARLGKEAVAALDKEAENYLRQMQQWRGPEDRYVARTVHKAIEYLEQVDRNKQFFLWVDSFDPHEPWNPPSVYMKTPCPYDPDYKGKNEFLPYAELVEGLYTEEQLRHVRMLYAELVTLCDHYLGELMDAVRRLGFEENTLFWMVSDHGEPMGNGEHGHGIMRKCRPWPYEELVHAPSILRVPGVKAGQRIRAFTQSVDVAPTVCDWLGIGVHPDMHGKSLLPLIRGEVSKVRDFAIAGYHKKSWAIYTDDWCFIHWVNARDAADGCQFIVDGMHEHAGHLQAVGGNVPFAEGNESRVEAYHKLDEAKLEDAQSRLQTLASVDGEAQWTCTPGSSNSVPESDELYDRRTDPFQLHNIIDQHPDVASRLWNDLRDFISELRAN